MFFNLAKQNVLFRVTIYNIYDLVTVNKQVHILPDSPQSFQDSYFVQYTKMKNHEKTKDEPFRSPYFYQLHSELQLRTFPY